MNYTEEAKDRIKQVLFKHKIETDGRYADSCIAIPIGGQPDYDDELEELVKEILKSTAAPKMYEALKGMQLWLERVGRFDDVILVNQALAQADEGKEG